MGSSTLGSPTLEPPDVVMSGLTEILVWIGGSLLSSRCSRLGPPYPEVKTPLHSASEPSGHAPLKGCPTSCQSKRAPSLSSAATPLGRREQLAEPCYLQAFKWVIES